MDLDQSLLDHPENGTTMRLPDGVVANAPYQGPAPNLPHIPVPLALPYNNAPSSYGPHRSSNSPAPHTCFAKTLEASRSATASPGPTGLLSRQAEQARGKASLVLEVAPTMRNASVLGLSEAQLFQITGGRSLHEAASQGYNWVYDMRREAQEILPYLYLGPSTAARDRTFLRRAGITKVIAIRDSRLATAGLLLVEHLAKEMGFESQCIDVPDYGALLRALPEAVLSINSHMLAAPTDANGVSTGKVLVYCETGNVRAPPVVVAYIMSMYSLGLLDTLRFVHKLRFCVSLDEEYKHMLLSFSDLLDARRDVADEAAQTLGQAEMQGPGSGSDDFMQDGPRPQADHSVRESIEGAPIASDAPLSPDHREARKRYLVVPHMQRHSANCSRSGSRPAKRHVEETMDDEDDRAEGASEQAQSREPSAEPARLNLDMARYQDRSQFVPFLDKGVTN